VKDRAPRVIAHLSDPHFGTVEPRVERALHADLRAVPLDLVVLTGDITQRARRAQFVAARAWMDALPDAPLLALPGNHDIPLFDLFTRLFRPYRLYRRYVHSDLERVYCDATLLVVGIDATRRGRHKHGVISRQQVEDTARLLRRSKAQTKIVATHQPLVVVTEDDVRNRARGAVAAVETWVEAGADLFLGGHIHLPYCREVAGRSPGTRAIVSQAGTAISRRTRGAQPNSYHRISLRGDGTGLELERRDFDARAERFVGTQLYVGTRLRAARCVDPSRPERTTGQKAWTLRRAEAARGRDAPAQSVHDSGTDLAQVEDGTRVSSNARDENRTSEQEDRRE